MNEKKLVKVSIPLYAGDLVGMGFQIEKIDQDYDFPFWEYYYFEDTQEFREAYNTVRNKKIRYERFLREDI